MALLDLSADKPTANTLADATVVTDAYTKIETAVNSIPEIVSYVGSSTNSSTAVTGTGTGDNLITFANATFANTKYYLEISYYIDDNSGNAQLQFYLLDGVNGSQVATWYRRTPVTNPGDPTFVRVPFTPSAGSHTFQVKWRDATGGRTYNIHGDYFPLNARIVQP